MTGNNHGNWVGPARSTDGADGFRFSDGLRHASVTPRLAGGDFSQSLPNVSLKFGSGGEIKGRQLLGHISAQRGSKRFASGRMPAANSIRRLSIVFDSRLISIRKFQRTESVLGVSGDKFPIWSLNRQFEYFSFIFLLHKFSR